jgi:hypothetical protein
MKRHKSRHEFGEEAALLSLTLLHGILTKSKYDTEIKALRIMHLIQIGKLICRKDRKTLQIHINGCACVTGMGERCRIQGN